MRIATYNVNGVNGRLPVLLRWLAETRPDVVCLQELKAPDAKFLEEAIGHAGYEAIWHGQKSWNGVAILSRVGTPVKPVAACLAIPMTSTAAISRRRSMASSSPVSIFPTATPDRDPNSTTSSAGSNA